MNALCLVPLAPWLVCPIERELLRFPSQETARTGLVAAQRHLDYLARLDTLYPGRRDDFDRWAKATKWHVAVWDALVDARGWYYSPEYRLSRLEHLRRLLGEADYLAGRTPIVFPLWDLSDQTNSSP